VLRLKGGGLTNATTSNSLVELCVGNQRSGSIAKRKVGAKRALRNLAEEAFDKRLKSEVSEEGHQRTWGHENHYNFRLKKCLFLEAREDVERGVRERKQLKLIDLQDNREIGVYVFIYRQSTTACSVQGKDCTSEEEWRALIKPFMED